MTLPWMEALMILDKNVERFVDGKDDNNPDNYQLYIDIWRCIARRALVGEFRHLRSKTAVQVFVKFP